MKNFRTILAVSALSFITLFSCSDDSSTESNNVSMNPKMGVNSYNTPENRAALTSLATDPKNLELTIKEVIVPGLKKMKDEGVDVNNVNEIISYYENCNDCYSEFKKALVPMFKEIANVTDRNEALSILHRYDDNLKSFGLNNEDTENLSLILGGMIDGTENPAFGDDGEFQYETNGFWDCLGETAGSAIGKGLVTGMVTGCVTGGYVGATTGTFVAPVLGTATGGVAGCIFGGAVGAVGGAATNAVWAALDCI